MKRGAQPTPVALDEVDLTDLDRFRDNLGWGQFDTLRREDPVHWHPEPAPNGGFWALTRHADIRAASRDADTRRSLPTDDPRQTAVRALIAREFRPHRLRQNYGAFLRELTKNVVCAALTEPEFDFVQRISADFPIQVLSRLLDVPKEVTRQLVAWSNSMLGLIEQPGQLRLLRDNPDLHQGGRRGRHVVRLRQPGRRRIHRPVPDRRHPAEG